MSTVPPLPETDTGAETVALVQTRHSLHAVAEQVLAAALYAATGRIGLRRTPGGFGTPPFPGPAGHRQLLVQGVELVVRDGDGVRRAPLTTLAAAGALAGTEPAAPPVYAPATTAVDPDVPLALDPVAAARLADWFALVDEAVGLLRVFHAASGPAPVQLWPEHFDLATSFDEVNFGGSPGDDDHDVPYLYVGPWAAAARTGPYWNEPFGASRSQVAVADVASAVGFLQEGWRRARGEGAGGRS